MIPASNTVLFQRALESLSNHKRQRGRQFKGRFVQIFLGLKFYQNNLPSMYSGSFVSTEVLQSLLDDLYAKTSRPANHCVLSLFESNYLARTGLVAPGNSGAQNTWRNNFNLQKGIGCYAPPADLSSITFLNEDRIQCRYLINPNPDSLSGARCSLCNSGAGYRRESHRKWLRIDPGGNGYAVLDLQLTQNYEPYLAPNGSRIPIIPLIIALYHEADPGLVIGTRNNVTLAEFMSDFNFSQSELNAYFDLSQNHPLNLHVTQDPSWPEDAHFGVPLVPRENQVAAPLPGRFGQRRTARPAQTPEPVLTGTPTPPPNTNTGWEAEQYVVSALINAGWEAHVVSRQQLGYDIFATKNRIKKYIEVKSSLGACSPSLTAREWQQANHHRDSFVLAIIENFNPTSQNTIYWIPNPANNLVPSRQTTIAYNIPRSSWTQATVPITHL